MAKKDESIQEAEKQAEKKIGTSSLAVYLVDAKTQREYYVRTYSVADHGEDFKELAEGYAKKIGGIVKKA